MFCFFWGIAAVVWIKFFYPKISAVIGKIPPTIGKILTWILVVFMAVNMVVSAMALVRYNSREDGKQAKIPVTISEPNRSGAFWAMKNKR